MDKFDRGIVYKDREVIVKHTLYTDGTINTVSMGELVRCKNCTDYQINFHWCGLHYMKMQPTDFCNYGELKKGDHNG